MKGFLVAFHLNDTKAENMFVLRTVERPRVGVKPGKSVFFLWTNSSYTELVAGATFTQKQRLAPTAEKSLVAGNKLKFYHIV